MVYLKHTLCPSGMLSKHRTGRLNVFAAFKSDISTMEIAEFESPHSPRACCALTPQSRQPYGKSLGNEFISFP